MAKKQPAADDGKQPRFEQAIERLEAIVRALEEGELGLEEALGRYEEGVKMLRHAHALLERAERRVELLTGVDSEGRPQTEPFDDRATES
ncbi:MAG: exodeoxyribonuclease VII small subunit [Thermoguttaceae bacterium]|jgi:exodeoxyribonuclease VII small subunit|nr:exodeoxyribonuclease VII small subunit [Thermoguttaceae bacterium]